MYDGEFTPAGGELQLVTDCPGGCAKDNVCVTLEDTATCDEHRPYVKVRTFWIYVIALGVVVGGIFFAYLADLVFGDNVSRQEDDYYKRGG